MKTVLDFSRVPLDKWVDLYNVLDNKITDGELHCFGLGKALTDIEKFAEVQVKEASDYDKELSEACVAWFENTGDVDAHSKLWDLIQARKEASGVKEDKVVTEAHSTEAEPFIPF